MDQHWTNEDVERFADGEGSPAREHLEKCAACASAVVAAMDMKHAVRQAMSVGRAPASILRRRSARGWWIAAAAVLALAVVSSLLVMRARTPAALTELADMHATILAAANPVDVISTDRHTVRPWFEGRVPFSVPVPELAGTPFRLIGGRVVYVHATQAAYLLIGKGAHRISLFVFRSDTAPKHLGHAPPAVATMSWESGGLTFVAVANVPVSDLEALRQAFSPGT